MGIHDIGCLGFGAFDAKPNEQILSFQRVLHGSFSNFGGGCLGTPKYV